MNSHSSKRGKIYFERTGPGLLELVEQLKPSVLMVIADTNTAKMCVPRLKEVVPQDRIVVLEPGDQHKTIASCQTIWSAMIKADLDRQAVVLNIGGGMICDLGGFAASCFKRGLRFVHIPTSLLAMTDAALGGKTGVNTDGYKNLIGQFNLPEFTWIDTSFLESLPIQELLNGMAEVVKHSIIGSPDLFDLLTEASDLKAFDWDRVILMSTSVKQRIVDEDPLERGIRKTLNFGHTVGHALESHFLHDHQPMSHGLAVTLGMLAETRIAEQMGQLKTEDFSRIISLIMRLLPPSEVTLPSLEAVLYWIAGDKKKSNGIVGFSLPDRIGSCQWDIEVPDEHIGDSLKWLTAHLKAFS